MINELIEKARRINYENRLRLLKGVALASTLAAVYYFGKNHSHLQVNFYPADPRNEAVKPVKSFMFDR